MTVRSKVRESIVSYNDDCYKLVIVLGCFVTLCVRLVRPCSSVLSWPLLQHHSSPVYSLSSGHVPDRVQTELLHLLPGEHHY